MSAERACYLDSSAIVKLAVREPESSALRDYLRSRKVLISSALATVEVMRALLPLGDQALRRGQMVLRTVELVGVTGRTLRIAGALLRHTLRSLDAVHLATMSQLGDSLSSIVTYDARLAEAAEAAGFIVATPA